MSSIEKASRAIAIVVNLLQKNKKRLAIWQMEMTYQCNKEQATDFVEVVEDAYNVRD